MACFRRARLTTTYAAALRGGNDAMVAPSCVASTVAAATNRIAAATSTSSLTTSYSVAVIEVTQASVGVGVVAAVWRCVERVGVASGFILLVCNLRVVLPRCHRTKITQPRLPASTHAGGWVAWPVGEWRWLAVVVVVRARGGPGVALCTKIQNQYFMKWK